MGRAGRGHHHEASFRTNPIEEAIQISRSLSESMDSSSLTTLPSEVLWRVAFDTGQHLDLFLACKLLRDVRHQYTQAAEGDDITDLSPLSSLSSLQTLNCFGCHGITNLSPLSSLSSLQTLDFGHCHGITNLSPLSILSSLTISTDEDN